LQSDNTPHHTHGEADFSGKRRADQPRIDSAVKDFANEEATKEEMRQLIRSHTKKFNRL
jgi:hypothetical protein